MKHWLLINLIGQGGTFSRLEVSRHTFLDRLSTSTPRLNLDEMNRRLASVTAGQRIGDSEYVMVGRDGNALYAAMKVTLTSHAEPVLVTGLQAITLINALPITVNVYESTGSSRSRDQLHLTLRSMLNSLLSEN